MLRRRHLIEVTLDEEIWIGLELQLDIVQVPLETRSATLVNFREFQLIALANGFGIKLENP